MLEKIEIEHALLTSDTGRPSFREDGWRLHRLQECIALDSRQLVLRDTKVRICARCAVENHAFDSPFTGCAIGHGSLIERSNSDL